MDHKPFYRIPENCYLFARKFGPEGLVRQWTLFELIRFYYEVMDTQTLNSAISIS